MGKQRKTKNIDLTVGNITSSLWKFAVPLMLGNVLQQLYNLVDTWVVGHYIGDNALAAVGSSYTLMTFLTSIVIGLCLGSSAFLSMAYGKKDQDLIRNGIFISAVVIGSLAVILTGIIYIWMNPMIRLLQVPQETTAAMREYLFYVFIGFFATFLYNYVANVLRGIGNSVTPLFFLGISVILNIFLDLYFVLVLHMGIKGAAVATVIAQYVSGVGILLYFLVRYPEYHISRKDMKWNRENLKQIMSLSGFTCLQQSVMNFGILVVQGIVNSFGATVMAAFAVAVKIDTIAYMPVGDFGNAFSVFVAQNYGAGKKERIRQGIRQSVISVILFCIVISCGVFVLAQPLMQLFVSETSREIIAVGVQYLRIEGACYVGIGILFRSDGSLRMRWGFWCICVAGDWMRKDDIMELGAYFKSIIDQDRAAVVICSLDHKIIYMNPAAAANYHKYGGAELLGKSLLDCHGAHSNEKIKEVVAWFAKSEENNLIYTSHNEKQNKDVYMVALRDADKKLIGYYEKHEYRNKENMEKYHMTSKSEV